MQKNRERISIQIPIGHAAPKVADDIVTAGEGLSLKGRAVLLLSAAGLESLLQNLTVNPETAALIVRVAKLLEAEKAAAARAERGQGGSAGVR